MLVLFNRTYKFGDWYKWNLITRSLLRWISISFTYWFWVLIAPWAIHFRLPFVAPTLLFFCLNSPLFFFLFFFVVSGSSFVILWRSKKTNFSWHPFSLRITILDERYVMQSSGLASNAMRRDEVVRNHQEKRKLMISFNSFLPSPKQRYICPVVVHHHPIRWTMMDRFP